MDENIKWMNTTYSQPRVMCQCKLYFFTTKRLFEFYYKFKFNNNFLFDDMWELSKIGT